MSTRRSNKNIELYHSGLKKLDQTRAQEQLKKQQEDQEIAETCPFHPQLIARKKYKRGERSEERPRAIDEFYDDMLKPIRNLHEKRESRKKANFEKQ